MTEGAEHVELVREEPRPALSLTLVRDAMIEAMSRDKRLSDAGDGTLKGYSVSPLPVSYELTIIQHWYDPSEGHTTTQTALLSQDGYCKVFERDPRRLIRPIPGQVAILETERGEHYNLIGRDNGAWEVTA